MTLRLLFALGLAVLLGCSESPSPRSDAANELATRVERLAESAQEARRSVSDRPSTAVRHAYDTFSAKLATARDRLQALQEAEPATAQETAREKAKAAVAELERAATALEEATR